MFAKSNRFVMTMLLVFVDLITLIGSFQLAYAIRSRLSMFTAVQPVEEYSFYFSVLIMLIIGFFGNQGLYRDIRDLSMIEEYSKIIKSLTYALLIAIAMTFFFKLYEQSRVLVFVFWIIATGLMISVRFLWYRLLKWLRYQGWNQMDVAIVGSEKKVKAVHRLLKQHAQLGYNVVSDVVLPRGTSPKTGKLQKKIDQTIVAPFQRDEIEGVIVSDSVKNYQYTLEVNEIFKERDIPHRNVTEVFDLTGFNSPGGEGLETMIANLQEGQVGGGYKVFKRFMDEVICISALIFSFPIWLLIMLGIKLESKGPIFFRQERVGYHGRKFLIYKFRSMYVDAPKYAKTPRGQGDPRVTRMGALLRKTSLDELPQLINVIKGDMSIVGPRPEMPFIVENYKAIYRYRLLVLPGVTGLWQVSGRTDKPLEENVKYDLYYIKNQSFLLDWVIILRTIPAVLFGRGAY